MTPKQLSLDQGTARVVRKYLQTSTNGGLRPRRWRWPLPALLGRARPGDLCRRSRTSSGCDPRRHSRDLARALTGRGHGGLPRRAFDRWALCPEMCAATSGREEDIRRGKVAAGLTHQRSLSRWVEESDRFVRC
jgi:hypothetical protein